MNVDIYERVDTLKTAIAAARPFEGHMLQQLKAYYRVGLTWTSNALEGNSLTEAETKILLEDGLTVGGKPLRDTYEALGHAEAYDYMFGLISERQISLDDILKMHNLFYTTIDAQNAGIWRNVSIVVTGTDYVFPAPKELDSLMSNLNQWIISERDKLHPVKFAAMLHLKFVTIHPFVDGNGRVARLLMNTALIQDGFMLAIVPPVLRQEYMDAIRVYQQKGLSDRFCDFIAERVIETEKDVIRLFHIPNPY